MINSINVFYSSKIGRGLKVVSKGLEPIQTKGKVCKKVQNLIKYKKHQALKF